MVIRELALRLPAAITPQSEFCPGVDRFIESGGASHHGEALRLAGSAETLSYALYRFPLGGAEPGVVSVDANPLADNGYFVGLAEYNRRAWEWYGPFRDNHVRILTPAPGDYTSPTGIAFACIAVWNGSEVDVVGVGVTPSIPGDDSPPPAPALLDAVGVVDGVELSWLSVPDADIAGYRIYHSTQPITDIQSPGVRSLGYLTGETTLILLGQDSAFFRVTAVDFNGNESDPSPQAEAMPLPGAAPDVRLTTDIVNCQRGGTITLEATGADSYDWDLDGDGSYDLMGDPFGLAEAQTGSPGLIRPKVRGQIGDFSCRACGSVSLIVSGNSRPLAIAHAFPPTGIVPLTVTFEGEVFDYDGEVLGAGWDFDGDGIYDLWDESSLAHQFPPVQQYHIPGLANARFRIIDNDGAFDVDTVAVNPLPEPENSPPIAAFCANKYSGPAPLNIMMNATASTDLDGLIVLYEWDWQSDGVFDYSTSDPECPHLISTPWEHRVTLRVTDDGGLTSAVARTFTATGPISRTVLSTHYVADTSLLIVEGNPAMFYTDSNTYDLCFVRATDTSGSAWGSPVTVASSIEAHHRHGSVIANGYPAAAYMDAGNLYFVRATDATGTAWGSPVTINNSGFVTFDAAPMIDVGGRPAVAFYHNAAPLAILFSRADDADGSAWSSPVTAQSLANSAGEVDLVLADGNPAVCYIPYDTSQVPAFKRSDDVLGTGWTTAAVSAGMAGAGELTMAVINGIPALAWSGYASSVHELRYVRADDPAGSAWTLHYPRQLIATGWSCFSIDLIELDGRPAIGCMDGYLNVAKYTHASDPDGLNWPKPMIFDVGGDTGLGMSGAIIEGRVAFSYIDDMQQLLRYTRMVE